MKRTTSLLALWKAKGRSVTGAAEAFERSLTAALDAGEAAHQLRLAPGAFIEHLARVLQVDAAEGLDALDAEGLYLAAACRAQQPGAGSRFEAQLFPQLSRTLGKMEGGSAFVEEVLQHMRVRLFADEKSSLLDTYSGRGALGAWLKVVAVRDAQRLRKKGPAPQSNEPDEVLSRMPSPAADPELAFLRLQHRKDFKEAFAEAMATLDARQRNVLQMNLVQGLSIDEVGKVYAVHRATAARWVSTAREHLVAETRKRLAAMLGLKTSELDSLMGAMRSQLSVTLSGLER
jgi:RNA polymerase sigma-70 factor (ECF subfamily)